MSQLAELREYLRKVELTLESAKNHLYSLTPTHKLFDSEFEQARTRCLGLTVTAYETRLEIDRLEAELNPPPELPFNG